MTTKNTQRGASHTPRARPGSGRVSISVEDGELEAAGAGAGTTPLV
jgi:hypothetical protein